MEAEFNIREATLDDVSAISVLGRSIYKEHFADIWHDIDSFLNTDFTNEANEPISPPHRKCQNSLASKKEQTAKKRDQPIEDSIKD